MVAYLAEEKMYLLASVITTVPTGLVMAWIFARTVARVICRMHGRLEDRRGLESAIRDTEPGDRADIVRAYAECLAAARRMRLREPDASLRPE